MERDDKPYYKKSWFSDRNQSLLDLLFNIASPDKSVLGGGKVEKDTLYPGLFGIYVVNDLTLFILALLVSKGYNTFGCKTTYLYDTDKYWYYSQMALFLVIYFVISIPYAELLPKYGEAVPPAWTLIASVVVWLLANAMSRLGETFVFYKPFFWPSPLTWYGFLGMSLALLYVVSDYYTFYHRADPAAQTTIILKYALLTGYSLIAGTFACIFSRNLYKRVIVGGESFVNFFFKLDSAGCEKNDELFKEYAREIKRNTR